MIQPPELEFQPPETIKKYQESQLPLLLSYLETHSPFYQDHFRKNSIDISGIRKLEDLQKIPPVVKNDLQIHTLDFLCVPKEQVVDYVTTSGTLGDPVTFALTGKDLDRLGYNEAISFACVGGGPGDVFQLMTTLDRRFIAGMAYFLGIRQLGASIVRVGGGIPELQWDTINRIQPNAMIVVPSFILRLIDYAEKNGIDYRNSSLKKAICIGESIRNPDFSWNVLGRKITDKWDLELYSTYASTEMQTAFTECNAFQGGHHHPEMLIVEFLDENDLPVAAGEPGEVTITTLGVEGMPLLRFKTGDICHFHSEKCACGRTTLRTGPVIGRRQQMIKYKGTTLYPPAVFDLLNDFPEIVNYQIELTTSEIGTDEMKVWVGTGADKNGLDKRIKDRFRAKLRVAPRIHFDSPEAIQKKIFPQMTRKPIKFVDKRTPGL